MVTEQNMQAKSGRNTRTQTVLVVSGSDNSELQEMSNLIQAKGYRCVKAASIEELMSRTGSVEYLALIIDVDSVAVNNRMIRDLKVIFPGIEFLCISGTRFHPNLQEAISHHFYACLLKPVDPDELFYWLKCIRENEPDTRASP